MNIIAPATAAGIGAIAVIRISGPDAITICNKNFKGKNLANVAANTVHFGTIRNNAGEIIDEVLVTVFRAPHSYTRENTVEISCHGSPYIVQKILELFLQNGCAMAQPGEFTQRAFLNGQLDLSQAEAVGDLIASESATQHRLAINQMRGGFSAQIKDLRNQLIHFASMIELELDFGEEDVEFADRTELNRLVLKIITVLERLLDSFRLGNVLKNGVATAIIGRPNAGKSTLLNALLQDDRAIVSSIAGTTRDTIEETFVLNGITFRLIDTAGIRKTDDAIEAIGVAKAYQKAAQASLILYVFDAKTMSHDAVKEDIISLLRNEVSLIVCGNKIDLLSANELENWLEALQPMLTEHHLDFIGIAAKDATNLDTLHRALTDTVNRRGTAVGDVVVSNARHAAALSVALTSLQAAAGNLHTGISSDFIAIDIRHAIHALGLVVGEVSTDDLLEKIFRDFCIGK